MMLLMQAPALPAPSFCTLLLLLLLLVTAPVCCCTASRDCKQQHELHHVTPTSWHETAQSTRKARDWQHIIRLIHGER
jgi:hypothetical protein